MVYNPGCDDGLILCGRFDQARASSVTGLAPVIFFGQRRFKYGAGCCFMDADTKKH
jgi:hypothetical protein